MPIKAEVNVGERVGARIIVAEATPIRGCTRVRVRCDCGVESVCYLTHFYKTSACKACSMSKHGANRNGILTSEYQSWSAMHQRCAVTNRAKASRYAERGIQIVDRWCGDDGFSNFLADMGPRPDGHTLERVDNDGPYGPDNCRWATMEEQSNNRSTNRRVTAFGRTQTLAQWSRETGIKPGTIAWRLASGKAPELALQRNL